MDEKESDKLVTDSAPKSDYGNGSVASAEEAAVEEDGKKSCCRRPKLVEPVFFLLGLALFAFVQVNQEYLYYRFEEDTSFPDPIRALLDGGDSDDDSGCTTDSDGDVNGTSLNDYLLNIEAELSSESSLFSTKLTLFRGIPPCFTILIVCSYSDTVGRRFGILLPCLGGMIRALSYLLVECYHAPLEWLYLGNFLDGLTGEHLAAVGCAYAYLYDTVPKKSLAFRFMIGQSFYFLASSIASLVIGVVIDAYGFTAAFVALLITYFLAFLYTLIILPESLPKENRQPFSFFGVFKDTVKSFYVFIKPRERKNDRAALILILVCATVVSIIALGTLDLYTVYVQGPPFCFSSTQIGLFLALVSANTVVSPPLFIKLFECCGLSDELIANLANVMGFLSYLLCGLAANTWEVYVAVMIILFGTANLPLCRSIMSRMVPAHEQGAIQASVSSLNAIGELISETVLIAIYSATVTWYYGTAFFVIAAILLLIQPGFIYVWKLRRGADSNSEQKEAP